MATLTIDSVHTKLSLRNPDRIYKPQTQSESFQMDYEHALKQMRLVAQQWEKEGYEVYVRKTQNIGLEEYPSEIHVHRLDLKTITALDIQYLYKVTND